MEFYYAHRALKAEPKAMQVLKYMTGNGIVVSFPQRADAEKVLREVCAEENAGLYIADPGPVLLEANIRGQRK